MNINWNNLKPGDLSGDMQEIAQDCGIEVARYLLESWGGSTLYIPTLSRLKRQRRDNFILASYDGTNEGELAQELGVSRRYVKDLIRQSTSGDS